MSTLKDRLTPEEWKAYRSAVNKRYHQSEKGQALMRRQNASPKAKERYARYRLTEKYRLAQERYHASQKWKDVSGRNSRREKELNPERVKARAAVAIALAKGTMIRPSHCAACGHKRKLHAHHWAGYEREFWLAIIWVCPSCHKALHA